MLNSNFHNKNFDFFCLTILLALILVLNLHIYFKPKWVCFSSQLLLLITCDYFNWCKLKSWKFYPFLENLRWMHMTWLRKIKISCSDFGMQEEYILGILFHRNPPQLLWNCDHFDVLPQFLLPLILWSILHKYFGLDIEVEVQS